MVNTEARQCLGIGLGTPKQCTQLGHLLSRDVLVSAVEIL